MNRIWPLGLLCSIALTFVPSICHAQGTKADYQRMQSLRERTSNKVYRTDVDPNWLPGEEHLWYRVRTGAEQYEFVLVDLEAKTRDAAFDHEAVARELTAMTGQSCDATNLPFRKIEFSEDRGTVYFRYAERDWKVVRASSILAEVEGDEWSGETQLLAATLRPSIDKGDEIDIEFVNTSTGEIRTIWIDRSGRRVPYQTIARGESAKQHTFEGHVWLVLNSEGDALAVYEADQSAPRVVVDGKQKLDIPNRRRGRGRGSRSFQRNAQSPDESLTAFVRDHHLFVRDEDSGEEFQLSESAEENNYFSERRFFWSPDSKYLVCLASAPRAGARDLHDRVGP